jgi:hypothetical protein
MTRISTPHDFALANGWDHTCIEATAELGVSPEDLDRLADTDVDSDVLLSWCRERVTEVSS